MPNFQSKLPESPSISALNKNFDFMSTNSPPAKASESAFEVPSAAVVASNDDQDVAVVGSSTIVTSGVVALKEEKLVDIANDPGFSMLHSGGGQVRNTFYCCWLVVILAAS